MKTNARPGCHRLGSEIRLAHMGASTYGQLARNEPPANHVGDTQRIPPNPPHMRFRRIVEPQRFRKENAPGLSGRITPSNRVIDRQRVRPFESRQPDFARRSQQHIPGCRQVFGPVEPFLPSLPQSERRHPRDCDVCQKVVALLPYHLGGQPLRLKLEPSQPSCVPVRGQFDQLDNASATRSTPDYGPTRFDRPQIRIPERLTHPSSSILAQLDWV